MKIEHILTPARTIQGAPASSKKKALQNAATLIAEDQPPLDGKALFRALIERERLGSTSIGEGIAIPHCRMPHIQKITGTLVSLNQPIEFQSVDGQPVDILFILLVPEQSNEDHLQVLSHLAGLFNQAEYRQSLRSATNSSQLYQLATAKDDEDGG
jgi:PTS system nitrogen regulatory IIA component